MIKKKAKGKSFLQPISLKITAAEKKEGRKRKSEEEERRQGKRKKAMVELLVFILATLEIVFERKPAEAIYIGGAVYKNSVRYIFKRLYWPAP